MLYAIAILALPSPVIPDTPQDVSLVQLLATPDRYHGKFVRVEGYLHVKFEDSALYLSKDDGNHLICKNAIWVSYADDVRLENFEDLGRNVEHKVSDFDETFVLLEGWFDKRDTGHMGAYSAGLNRVTKVGGLKRWYK